MQCAICEATGTEVLYRASKRQVLCRKCNQRTPDKMGKRLFDLAYWWELLPQVKPEQRRLVYRDYLHSPLRFVAYKQKWRPQL